MDFQRHPSTFKKIFHNINCQRRLLLRTLIDKILYPRCESFVFFEAHKSLLKNACVIQNVLSGHLHFWKKILGTFFCL